MGASENPPASHGIDIQHFDVERFNQWLDLGIPQLSYIELSAIRRRHPAKEDIRCWLHEALSHHDALTVMTVFALASVRFKYGLDCFFELKKKRIVGLRHQQYDPASSPDASNPDNLDCCIHKSIAIEQHAPVIGKRFAVGFENLVERSLGFGGTRHFRVKDQRRLVGNANLSANRTR